MAVISSIIGGIVAAATAIGHAAVGLAANIGFGIIGAIGGSSAIAAAPTALGLGIGFTVMGGSAALLGAAGMGIASAYSSARESAAMQQKQAEAIKKLQQEQAEGGILEVNKTQQTLQDNSRKARTLSSLRIGMLPQAQDKEEVTRNAYGVDTNQVATATQNMMGLNIAVA